MLRLVAAGRTNREIAAELALSVRTVERHITNLYGKIDARQPRRRRPPSPSATAWPDARDYVVPGAAARPRIAWLHGSGRRGRRV